MSKIKVSGNKMHEIKIKHFLQTNVTLVWSGWTDDLAGVHHYDYEIYELLKSGDRLVQDLKPTLEKKDISSTEPKVSVAMLLFRFNWSSKQFYVYMLYLILLFWAMAIVVLLNITKRNRLKLDQSLDLYFVERHNNGFPLR